jgi:hypothetical protein
MIFIVIVIFGIIFTPYRGITAEFTWEDGFEDYLGGELLTTKEKYKVFGGKVDKSGMWIEMEAINIPQGRGEPETTRDYAYEGKNSARLCNVSPAIIGGHYYSRIVYHDFGKGFPCSTITFSAKVMSPRKYADVYLYILGDTGSTKVDCVTLAFLNSHGLIRLTVTDTRGNNTSWDNDKLRIKNGEWYDIGITLYLKDDKMSAWCSLDGKQKYYAGDTIVIDYPRLSELRFRAIGFNGYLRLHEQCSGVIDNIKFSVK